MLCWYHDAVYIYLAMEYHELGNLKDWIHDYPLHGEHWARAVTLQVLRVLVQLDLNSLAHRNIKPSVCIMERTLDFSLYKSNVTLEHFNRFRDADQN